MYTFPQGTNVDIIKILAQDMNFTLSLYEVLDGKFGSFDEATQTWNGVMGDVVQNKADISIADLIVTETRAKSIKFTTGIYWIRDKLYMKKPKSSYVWTTFLTAFQPSFWLGIFLVYILLTPLFLISKRYLEANIDLSTSIVSVWLAVMALDVKQLPTKLSTRITVLIICLFGALIWWCYNAALVSFLTVNIVNTPIDSLKELLNR